MPILSVVLGKDQHNAIDLTEAILNNYVRDDILTLPASVNLNSIKYDPFPGEAKHLYITYAIGDIANVAPVDESRFFDVVINTNIASRNTKNMDNILIYPHLPYHEDDGGLNVMYNFAKMLDEMGKNARIFPTYGHIQNSVYNKYFINDFEIKNSLVIYCEGTQGNPLNAPHVVRWMLSPLGTNVTLERGLSFGKGELVYYFNSELKFQKKPEWIGKIYKNLGLLCINSAVQNHNGPRNEEWCFTHRKSYMHKTPITYIHPENAAEILRNNSQEAYVHIFNHYTYFVSYDPLTFLTIIAGLCGCISIVYPMEGISKKEWVKMTAVHEYLEYKNLDYFYGVAYGIEDIEWAKATTHLMKEQWDDIIQYYKDKHIGSFLKDIENMEQMQNTVENNYYGFDCEYLPSIQYLSGNYYYILPELTERPGILYNIRDSFNKTRETSHYAQSDPNYWDTGHFENYYYFFEKCMKEKRVTIRNPNYIHECISTEYYFLTTEEINIGYPNLICNYYFPEQDIVLGISLGTAGFSMFSEIVYLFSFPQKTYLKYANIDYKYLSSGDYLKKLYTYKNKLLQNIPSISTQEPDRKTIYGYHQSVAHNLCNDLTGIYVMDKMGFANMFDEVIFGLNNVFYIKEYLIKNHSGIRVTEKENIYDMEGQCGRGVFMKYNHFYLSDQCCDFIQNYLSEMSPISEEKRQEIESIRDNYYPIFTFSLRSGANSMKNQDVVMGEVMHKLMQKYPRAYFLLDGFCGFEKKDDEDPVVTISNDHYSDLLTSYEKLVENIKTAYEGHGYTSVNVKSLMNAHSATTVAYLKIATAGIYQNSTSVLQHWVVKIPGIYFSRPYMKHQENLLTLSCEKLAQLSYINDTSKILFLNDNTDRIADENGTVIDRRYIISSETIVEELLAMNIVSHGDDERSSPE